MCKEEKRAMKEQRHQQNKAETFFDTAYDLESLAAQQGVSPMDDPETLSGDFWPEDESVDEFIAAVREWRREAQTERVA
jgi:hypothetical protein